MRRGTAFAICRAIMRDWYVWTAVLVVEEHTWREGVRAGGVGLGGAKAGGVLVAEN